ncbi:hypothetical protein [Streptomyces sp. NPDC004783]|uniref:hypothetical protein n=1 Tax=Streptomyces sp. NPDC004783 TaxID=3154459 RepID=UPI0033BD0C93
MRQRERADLVRLEAYVRETVLPRTHPYTTERRRVMEALGAPTSRAGLLHIRSRSRREDLLLTIG